MLSPRHAQIPAPLPQEPPQQPSIGIPPSYPVPIPMSPSAAIRSVSPHGFTPRPGSIVQQVSKLPLGVVPSPRAPMVSMTPGGTVQQVPELPPGFVPTGPTVPAIPGVNTPRNSSQLLRPLSRANTVGRTTPVGNM